MRGSTSKAVFFHQRDLPHGQPPNDTDAWSRIFPAVMGSPDPNRRQLNGMGGGLSSLSKVAVVGSPSRPDADVDYTFAQVAITEAVVGYRGNCGNISSAVGLFAVQECLATASGDMATIRIHNTNTGKIIVARFPLIQGQPAVEGDLVYRVWQEEVRQSAPILYGSKRGHDRQTAANGTSPDVLDLPDFGQIEASLVDAANPTVFVAASAIGLTAAETPDALARDREAMARFEAIRVAAAVKMGLVATEEEAQTRVKNLPIVSLVAASAPSPIPSGILQANEMDLLTRMISSGQPDRATPLTAAMCLAIAANIPGSVVHPLVATDLDPETDIRIGHASGVSTVAAKLRLVDGTLIADETTVYRTARRLMDGRIFIPAG
jgi:2-methylaconitate cis-trans-isomerase PrpF